MDPIHESDTGELAPLLENFKSWMNTYGCAFVFCRKTGEREADAAHRYRGPSALNALVDAHLELREIKPARLHRRTRPIPLRAAPNTVYRPARGRGRGRHGGALCHRGQEPAGGSAAPSPGVHQEPSGRCAASQQILQLGADAGFKQHALDLARKHLIVAGELDDAPEGKSAGIIQRRPD